MKKINFCSGPALLNNAVYTAATEAIHDFNGSGLSILELSHRSSYIVDMIDETKMLVKKLLHISDEYEVLFLHGGASLQFPMIPMNFLLPSTSSYYAVTGQWASNALKEATLFGNTKILCDSSDANFNYLPTLEPEYALENTSYVHFTSNNTIYGTQWKSFPKFNVPLFVDMSSDIFSKQIDVNKFDFIYAGAQKNLGIAGVCLVIIKKELLKNKNHSIPTMLDYSVHIKHASSFNTPPVFPIYTCNSNLKWLLSIGGIDKIEKINQEKAALFYHEINRNKLFECTVPKENDRSLMNITFTAINQDIEAKFKEVCNTNGIIGIDGYRTVGGFRASIYNAFPIEDVKYFISLMQQFESQYSSNI